MTTRSQRRLAPRLIAGATAAALGAAALAAATPALAATTTTATIMGSPLVNVGTSWYDTGESTPTNPGPSQDVKLTATQSGANVKVTVEIDAGPHAGPIAISAGNYQLDAFVRLDGSANVRGKHFNGPVGTNNVAAHTTTFASGVVIKGTFKNVKPGQHTLTLTDLMMDSVGPTSGGLDDDPQGFDVFYNPGTTYAQITGGTDWALSTSLAVVDTTGPKVSLTKPNKPTKVASWTTLKGKSTDQSGVKSVKVKLTEKRGKSSYYYTGKTWKKASSAKKAKASAKTVNTSLKNSGSWSLKVKGLKSGTLDIHYWGVDKIGEKSSVKNYTTKKLS